MILQGDCRDVLRTLPSESVQCCVTSPPYWGLRSYLPEGDPLKPLELGLEPTPEEYVANMVEVFREVRRVLRPDGVLWLNLGDSYTATTRGGGGGTKFAGRDTTAHDFEARKIDCGSLKPKDLVGIPWAVATALRDPYYAGRIKRVEDRAWLAAIIDGEGTITATRHERKDDGRIRTIANVFVTNSCSAMLDRCAEIWPGGLRHEHMRPSEGHLGTKNVYRWIPPSAADKALLLRELYPHFVSKKKQALLAWNLLEFMKEGQRLGKSLIAADVRAKRERLVEMIQALNHGEDVDVPTWCKEPPSLLEQGFYLRSDVIWSKSNPMPESVTDRPTKAHEYLFLLTKSDRYFYDAEAIAEEAVTDLKSRQTARGSQGYAAASAGKSGSPQRGNINGYGYTEQGKRNARTVWTIPTRPFPDAHFAVFPPELARRCILAGTSERGCCPECGAPWERVVERETLHLSNAAKAGTAIEGKGHVSSQVRDGHDVRNGPTPVTRTTGWRPTCDHDAEPVPCTVLDPFSGAGTTGLVAQEHGRRYIGIELNPEYIAIAERRLSQQTLWMEAAS